MIILVTGCSGFIGSHLCERLIDCHHNVIGIDIRPLPKDFRYPKKITFLIEDIRNKIMSIGIHKPDLVIHLAALAGVHCSTKKPREYAETNIIGTINLLEECKTHKVTQIIYASSSTVYANEANKEKLGTPFSLLSPYAITKKSCEMLFHYYNIQSVGLRFFSVYGPRGRHDMAPYIFMKNILNDDIVNIFGTGCKKRDFTFITDIIDGIMLSITYINENRFRHEVFNLGNCKSFTIRHFINVIETCTNKKAKIKYLDKRECDSEITHADLTRARELLNYQPIVTLEEGIKKTIEYLKKQN